MNIFRIRNRRVFRTLALVLGLSMVAEMVAPAAVFAITSGPSQPDFASFEPVATTNMVDPASGGFTYNLPVVQIPGPGGGYALSLSYHSGVRPTDDASWVGYGWTLNPGAINRSVQGVPDDFSGQNVKTFYKGPADETIAAGYDVSFEAFSIDVVKLSVGYSKMVRFNNYRGLSFSEGLTTNIAGYGTLSYQADGHTGKFGISISPMPLLGEIAQFGISQMESILSTADPSGSLGGFQLAKSVAVGLARNAVSATSSLASGYTVQLLSPRILATSSPQFSSDCFKVGIRAKIALVPIVPGEIGPSAGFEGSYTVQRPSDHVTNQAYGIMYQGRTERLSAQAKSSVVYDYSTDRENPYTDRDLYLHAPFSTPDSYNLTGESLAGSFQAHNRKLGIVHPPQRSSVTNMHDIDARVSIGFATGGGGSGTKGKQESKVRPWSDPDTIRFASATDTMESWYDGEPVFFRFTGDLGGKVGWTESDDAVRVPASRNGPNYDGLGIDTLMNDGARSGRSSNISYVTNREMYAHYSLGKLRRAYTPISKMMEHVDRSEACLADLVGEFTVTNESGVTYTYGLPVFARNEKNLQYGVAGSWGDAFKTHPKKEQSHHSNAPTVNGQVREDPYVSTYLLTQILSSDYVDRTDNGPSSDDFGSYTVFSYQRCAGTYLKEMDPATSHQWYRWRTPYTGQYYQPGRMLDNKLAGDYKDDRGIVSSGEKEVYFLESIQTKTHTAVFVTNKTNFEANGVSGAMTISGSQRERLDAYEAYNPPEVLPESELEKVSASDPGKIQTGYDGIWKSEFAGRYYDGKVMTPDKVVSGVKANKNRYLERIELWSMDSTGVFNELLQTARFEYDYSTMMAGTGKWEAYDSIAHVTRHYYSPPTDLNSAVGLTLHNLWPETAETAVGLYRYGKLTLRRVWFEYGGVKSARISPYEFDYRNPPKSEFASHITDKYGAVFDGYPESPPTLDSTGWLIDKENPSYDEASTDRWAYHTGYAGAVKRSNYAPYVPQVPDGFDPAAWNLKSITLPSGGRILIQYEQTDYLYVQDQIATAMTPLTLVNNDDNYVEVNVKKIGVAADKIDQYATMLRSYVMDRRLNLRALYQFQNCAPYVGTTFPTDRPVDFVSCYLNSQNVEVVNDSTIRVSFNSDQTPHDAAVDYARANRAKDYDCSGKSRVSMDKIKEIEFWGAFVANLLPLSQILQQFQVPPTQPILQFSYLRLPVLKGKLGGGIRVKRLLMYDKGLEAGDEVLYGTEYIYKKWQEVGGVNTLVSSGVASNEPNPGREENCLVQPIKQRETQDLLEEILYGADLDKFEGPLCESCLPSPGITHSQVVMQSINDGVTNTGHTIASFWTWQDHPVSIAWTTVEKDAIVPIPVIDFLSSISTEKFFSSQGYAIIIPGMNARQKSTIQCQGRFSTSQPESPSTVATIEYEYFKTGEGIPVLDSGVFGGISLQKLGREEQITLENRIVTDRTELSTISIDAGINFPSLALLFPTPFFTGAYTYSLNDKACAMSVVTKVISYPAVVKRVIQEHRGVRQVTENVAFNPETGRPAITMTYDAFNKKDLQQSTGHIGTLTQIEVPGSAVYAQLGQMAANDRMYTRLVSYERILPDSFKLKFPVNPVNRHWLGDLVHVRANAVFKAIGHVTRISGDTVFCKTVSWSAIASPVPATGNATVELLRSGRKNYLTQTVGSVVAYGLDSAFFANTTSILNDADGIISASASILTENWPIDQAEYGTVSGTNPNSFEKGNRGRWAPSSNWVYSDSTLGSTQGTQRIYKGGVVASAWAPFDWNASSQNSKWIMTDSITKFDPFANPTESKNAINVYSSVRFSHSQTMPSIIAVNAQRSGILFQSFEDRSGVDTSAAHTGRRSLKLTDTSVATTIDNIDADAPNNATGVVVRLWVKSVSGAVNVQIGSIEKTPAQIGRSGDWRLVEAKFSPSDFSGLSATEALSVRPTGSTPVWVDDVRMVPFSSKSTCYAYDRSSLRLIAQFDESHFATIYQYDGQGRLTRLVKETERGIKTVKDGSYHQPLVERHEGTGDNAVAYFSVMKRFGNMGISRVGSILNDGVQKLIPANSSPGSLEGQFDVLEMNIGIDSTSTSIFGRRVDTLLIPKQQKQEKVGEVGRGPK